MLSATTWKNSASLRSCSPFSATYFSRSFGRRRRLVITRSACACMESTCAGNQLHWVLDVIMDEDQARNRKDHGPQNLALLRKLALNLAKIEPSKGSMRGKLKRAGWDNAFLAQILTQFANFQMR